MNLTYLIYRLFELYQLLIVIWCILTWVPRTPGGFLDDVSQAIGTLVEPFLGVFRGLIPPFGGIDFSPIVAILVLRLIMRLVLAIL